ncbi:MAG: hypothetical protein Kow0065_25000 [Methylomicrobium sp.]
MKLQSFQLTSAGDKEINQDAMGRIMREDYSVFVVADGLGGHQSGEKASRYFCQGILQLADTYSRKIESNPIKTVSEWFDAAVLEMKRLFGDDPSAADAHTTCALLYLDDTRAITAHCGDSRVYRINPTKVLWRTQDHSITQQLLDEGVISEHEMGLHPEQNQLTRSINIRQAQTPEIHVYPAMKLGETFLLCTDGFWEFVKPTELIELGQPESGKSELGKIARLSMLRAKGRCDNITVQWVRNVG